MEKELNYLSENKQVLDVIKNKVTHEEFTDILHVIEICENTSDYLITDKPKGKFQIEDEFEVLKGMWIKQTTSGGFTGDEFSGTVSVKISEEEYFQFSYLI